MAGMTGKATEEVHFDEPMELAGGEFVFEAESVEEGEIEQLGCGDADADAL